MVFDVMIREGFNDKGKQIINVYRIWDVNLSASLRLAQDKEMYIISVIPLVPLFKYKKESMYSKSGLSEEREQIDPVHFGMSHIDDPHGF